MSDGSIVRPKYRKKGDETHLSFITKYEDREILHKVKKILNTKAIVHDYPNYKSPNSKLRVYDCKDVINQYSDIKNNVPKDIIGFERHYIRGAIDGDGTLSIRKRNNTFRIGFISESENIISWIVNHLIDALHLPEKKYRWVPQSNVFEILWEGTIAKYIAWYLYSGNIENIVLKRKHDKYKKEVIANTTKNKIEELFISCNAYIDDNLEIVFNSPSYTSLDWAKRFQKQLPFKTTPVCHNKGKTKYYRLYIVDKNLAANMRDSLNLIV